MIRPNNRGDRGKIEVGSILLNETFLERALQMLYKTLYFFLIGQSVTKLWFVKVLRKRIYLDDLEQNVQKHNIYHI